MEFLNSIYQYQIHVNVGLDLIIFLAILLICLFVYVRYVVFKNKPKDIINLPVSQPYDKQFIVDERVMEETILSECYRFETIEPSDRNGRIRYKWQKSWDINDPSIPVIAVGYKDKTYSVVVVNDKIFVGAKANKLLLLGSFIEPKPSVTTSNVK